MPACLVPQTGMLQCCCPDRRQASINPRRPARLEHPSSEAATTRPDCPLSFPSSQLCQATATMQPSPSQQALRSLRRAATALGICILWQSAASPGPTQPTDEAWSPLCRHDTAASCACPLYALSSQYCTSRGPTAPVLVLCLCRCMCAPHHATPPTQRMRGESLFLRNSIQQHAAFSCRLHLPQPQPCCSFPFPCHALSPCPVPCLVRS